MGLEITKDHVSLAALSGNKPMLTTLLATMNESREDKGIDCLRVGASALLSKVARSGHLDTLAYLLGLGLPWSDSMWRGAASRGHVHILEWGHKQGYEFEPESLIVHAQRKGCEDVIKWCKCAAKT